MATNIRIATHANSGKQTIKDVQSGEVLRIDGATQYLFEVNGQKGLPAGTKFKRNASSLTLEFPDQSTLELAGAVVTDGTSSVDMAAIAQQLSEQGAIALQDTSAPLLVAQADAADIRNNSLGKADVTIGDVVQHATEAAPVIVAGSAGGEVAAAALLSTEAMVGIGLGVGAVGAVGAAAGSSGGSSTSAGATPSAVESTPPVSSGSPTATLAVDSNTGSTGDLITKDTTPTITGTGQAGDTITVTLSSDGSALTTIIAADGTWSVTAPEQADGVVTFTIVEQAPGAGVAASAPIALTVTIDNAAPVAGDVATIGADGTINASEAAGLAIAGSGAEAGASISVLISDASGDHSKTVTGIVGSDGSWSIASGSLSGMPDGNYLVAATVTDAAGNASTSSASFVLDTSAPATPITPDMIATNDTGSSNSDNITSNASASYIVAAGGNAGLTIYVDGVQAAAHFGTSGADAIITLDAALSDGTHSIAYRQTDAQGNSSTSVALSVSIDTAAPATPVAPDMTATTDLGASNSDNITSNTSPAFALGTVAAGEAPQLYFDGGSVAAGGTYNAITGIFTVTDTLAEGAHYATSWVVDAAGNTSPISPGQNFTIDTTAPTQTASIVSVTDDAGQITGTLSTGATTDDIAPVLNGTLSAALVAGDHVVVYRDGVALGDAAVDGTNWTFADAGVPVSTTAHSYTAQVVDAVDLHGSLSTGFALTENATQTLGGSGADTLNGGATANNLWGGAGADALVGGVSNDLARYDFAVARVDASLAGPAGNTGEAAGDTYTSIEGLVGTDYNDGLTGDDNANGLFGLLGNDTLTGGAGDDYLRGGTGNDTLNGGAGNDSFNFMLTGAVGQANGNGDAKTILDFSSTAGSNFDVISLSGLVDFGAAGLDLSDLQGAQQVVATVSGADLLLTLGDTPGAQSTITLANRADLYDTSSAMTLDNLFTAGQLTLAA